LAGLSSGYFRLRAGYRLPAGKYTGILTYFQVKINKKTNKRIHRRERGGRRDFWTG